jgi:hypothetical protein
VVELFAAIGRGEREALGLWHPIALGDRMDAVRWLGRPAAGHGYDVVPQRARLVAWWGG